MSGDTASKLFDNLVRALEPSITAGFNGALRRMDNACQAPMQALEQGAFILGQTSQASQRALFDPCVDRALRLVEEVRDELPEPRQSLVRALRETLAVMRLLPAEVVDQYNQHKGLAAIALKREHALDASGQSRFARIVPEVRPVLQDSRDFAHRLEAVWPHHDLYSRLMQLYGRGTNLPQFRDLAHALRPQLTSLGQRILASNQAARPNIALDLDDQEAVCSAILRLCGFDFDAGRVVRTHHGTCWRVGPANIVAGIELHPQNFLLGLRSALHEGGHSLDFQGRPLDIQKATPDELLEPYTFMELWSFAHDEWLPATREFWKSVVNLLRRFPVFRNVEAEELWHWYNAVQFKPDWFERDRVTVTLKQLDLTELESQLINGELSVEDVQAALAERRRQSFGCLPHNIDSSMLRWGALFNGSYGYTPQYVFSMVAVAAIWDVFESVIDWREAFQSGRFSVLGDWMGRVIGPGCFQPFGQFMTSFLGHPLRAEPFLRYAEDKALLHSGVRSRQPEIAL